MNEIAPRSALTAGLSDSFFLPNFCGIRLVFAVVVVAELLAFILVLAGPWSSNYWGELGLVSLFVQWVALVSAAVLCGIRRWLMRMSSVAASLVSYLSLLLVTVVLSEIAFRLAGMADQPGLDHAGFLLRNLAISALVSGMVLRYFYVRHQWAQQVQAEAQARVQALQARIRPHFLFNSLNTIAALTSSRPELAEEVVQDLAELFRVTMRDMREQVTLEQELNFTRSYLRIEAQRLGDRLSVDWTLKNLPLQAPVPALVLQPLVENAVYHGIEPRAGGGRVHILATYNKGVLRLEVRNPLPTQMQRPQGNGNRMALDNIRERLQLAYGPEARLEMDQREGLYRVRVLFPLTDTGEAPE
ncbi:MAG: histidine kinase [Gammaproteobacteria bacterium]|nr:histidine kinase [Gammaproteobacteria bacterium]MBU2478500.1 histidine kinase [Gammaproteobacteria bacterium]